MKMRQIVPANKIITRDGLRNWLRFLARVKGPNYFVGKSCVDGSCPAARYIRKMKTTSRNVSVGTFNVYAGNLYAATPDWLQEFIGRIDEVGHLGDAGSKIRVKTALYILNSLNRGYNERKAKEMNVA
jgi:hypothetical protein